MNFEKQAKQFASTNCIKLSTTQYAAFVERLNKLLEYTYVQGQRNVLIQQRKGMNHNQAACELQRRGYKYSETGPLSGREYWVRTDGEKDIFLDHSATLTPIGHGVWLISDFLERGTVRPSNHLPYAD
jgi:hypothetical protein